MPRPYEQKRTEQADEVKVLVDSVNEQVVIAAMLVDDSARAGLARRLVPDHFQAREHRPIVSALREMVRRGMGFDVATLQKLAKDVDPEYVAQLVAARPVPPPNLDYHVQLLLWDHARITAVRGPLAELLEAMRDPRAEPERVRSLSRQLHESLSSGGDRRYMRDSDQLVAEVVGNLRARRDGMASYPFGLRSLDYHEQPDAHGDPVRRLIPGAAPGKITVVVGVPGAGKSTFTARLALGLAKQRRRVAMFAWEQNSPTSIEMLACMSLGWPRSRISDGKSPRVSDAKVCALSDEELDQFRARCEHLGKHIVFIDIPFNRHAREKVDNERNLDIVQEYVEASGAQVCIFDLWKRCLRYTKPEDEELALIRQQAMAEETQTHHVLVAHLRAKDVEGREDKRPTREGIKGSGAWIEVPDTILGTHRPGLWKGGVEDNVFEVDGLKQRYGKWPWAVEFDWEPDAGTFSGGRTVAYDAFTTSAREPGGRRGVGSILGGERNERRRGW